MNAAERLRGIQIENRPAVQLIREFHFQNVLIYADPPYILGARSCPRAMYKHEMTDDDHDELLNVLRRHPGPVILSGYASPMYDSQLSDWYREEIETRDQVGHKKREVLWMNFKPCIQQQMAFTEVIASARSNRDARSTGEAKNAEAIQKLC